MKRAQSSPQAGTEQSGISSDDVPVGTPVNAHGSGQGSVERSTIKKLRFVQRFPDRQVGNERVCTHTRIPPGSSKHYDDEKAGERSLPCCLCS